MTVDEVLSAEDRAALESTVVANETLKRELEDYQTVLRLVRSLPPERPPSRFTWAVQQRIRRRTRGRWFGVPRAPSLVFEAAVCATLLFLMAALYLFGAAGPTPPARDSEGLQERVILAPSDRRVLAEYGTIEMVGTSVIGDELTVSLAVPNTRVEALESAVSARRSLTMVPTSRYRSEGVTWMQVRAQPGPIRPRL